MKHLLLALFSGLFWYLGGLATMAHPPMWKPVATLCCLIGGGLAGILASRAGRGDA